MPSSKCVLLALVWVQPCVCMRVDMCVYEWCHGRTLSHNQIYTLVGRGHGIAILPCVCMSVAMCVYECHGRTLSHR